MPQDPKGPNSTHLLTYRPLAIYLRLNQNVLVLIKIYAEAVRTHQHSREAANASFHNRGLYRRNTYHHAWRQSMYGVSGWAEQQIGGRNMVCRRTRKLPNLCARLFRQDCINASRQPAQVL